ATNWGSRFMHCYPCGNYPIVFENILTNCSSQAFNKVKWLAFNSLNRNLCNISIRDGVAQIVGAGSHLQINFQQNINNEVLPFALLEIKNSVIAKTFKPGEVNLVQGGAIHTE